MGYDDQKGAMHNAKHAQMQHNGVFHIVLSQKAVLLPSQGTMAIPVVGGTIASKVANIRDGLSQTLGFSENLVAADWGNIGVVDTLESLTDPNLNSPRVKLGMVYLYREEANVNRLTMGAGHPEFNNPISSKLH